MIKVSIITPYYNTLKETQNLAKILEPQLTEEVEWLICDDGCNELELDKLKAKVIHLEHNSGGASVPRNMCLDIAQGQYIAFIDSDDTVTNDYIKQILNKIENEFFEYCLFSWNSPHLGKIIIDENHPIPEWNCCIWNCIYNKDTIGENRFNPKLVIAEDYDFNQRVRCGKRAYIHKILYHYSKNNSGLTHTYIDSKNKPKTKANKVYDDNSVLVEALPIFKQQRICDFNLGRVPRTGEQWKVNKDRLEILLGKNAWGKPLVKIVKK